MGLSPDDIATIVTSVVAAAGTLGGVWAMIAKTRAEVAKTRAEIAQMRQVQQEAHAETKEAMRTNHGSRSIGDAIDRLTADVAATRKSMGGLRDDVRGLRSETSARVNELAERITAESERQSVHEQACPARIPMRRSISHPPNPSDD